MFGLSILSATVEGPGKMLGDTDTAATSSSASSSLQITTVEKLYITISG